MGTVANSFPSTSRSRRNDPGRRRRELEAAAPFVAWPTLYGYLRREFGQGDHVAILGPTGSGKTHLAFEVAELRSHVIGIALKPADPLIDDARQHGYRIMDTSEFFKHGRVAIPYSDGRPVYPRIIYWPRGKYDSLAEEKRAQAVLVRKTIKYVRDRGRWALLLDEGTWVTRDLNLQRDVDSALFQFRSLKSSVIVLGQRPSWMGRYVLSSPTHLFLFNTNDGNDRKSLGDISGVDSKAVAELVGNLDYDAHEFLYLDTRRRQMFRSVAPPR